MIATDHQARVTRDKMQRFEASLETLREAGDESPSIAAIQAQLKTLRRELAEYEELCSGSVTEFEASSLEELPVLLIKARIARGMSQSGLAQLLGVKPQQVQRWESEKYDNAAWANLLQVARTLRVTVAKKIELADVAPLPVANLKKSLRRLGVPKTLIEQRLIPDVGGAPLTERECDFRLQSLLGASARNLVAAQFLPSTSLQFKLPATAEQSRTRAFATYVDGVCRLVARTAPRPSLGVPRSWSDMRTLLFGAASPNLTSTLDACWRNGIPVFCLQESIAFHGACWKQGGQVVIALKQSIAEESRWLIDLIHELYHAAVSDDDFTIIEAEETSAERRNSTEEKRATRFAAEVITGGRAEAVTTEVVEEGSGRVERFKRAAQIVAERHSLPVGVVANLLAHRLAQQGVNWWGVAASLQPASNDPLGAVRRAFDKHARLGGLSEEERDLLFEILEPVHVE